MPFDTQSKVQKLLGVELPDKAADLHYYKWQPSAELSYYIAYIKFDVSAQEFVDLIERMETTMKGVGASPYLPTSWNTVPEVHLDWWDPSPDTPEVSAARPFGLNGWIVAKHERGTAYLIATDTGRVEVDKK
jgi:hypothetical protein